MPELLFEIGTEELPALEIPRLAEQLKREAEAMFVSNGLSYRHMESFYTPRRLTLRISELTSTQNDRTEEIKGPPADIAFDREGNPTQAAIGFAKNAGVASESLEQVQVGDKLYAVARRVIPGRETVKLLPELLSALVERLRPSKSMRWDTSGLTFLRPIRWLVCLCDEKVIPVRLGTLRASRTTRGHRFLSRRNIRLEDAAEYESRLAKAFVVVDAKVREDRVMGALNKAAGELGCEIILDKDLLGRIVNGAEHPTPVLGHVPEDFLDLPPEIIQAALREEGKFVPLRLPNGTVPWFMGFRDGLPDGKGIVQSGFERVVRARLRDSRFFFNKDRQTGLAKHVRELKDVIYDVRLGSVWAKVERIRSLAEGMARCLGKGHNEVIDRAAFLCKADLVTEIVKAFPDLQGTAGAIYAKLDQEPEEVVTAIREHYLPLSFDDELPTDDVGTVISLADKLDTVVGALLVGEVPTGSRDPYGIRRAANGLIRLAVEKGIDLDFLALVKELKGIYAAGKQTGKWEDVGAFLSDRACQLFRQRYGIGPNVVVAIEKTGVGNFYRALLRAQAIAAWQKRPGFAELVVASSRARNITKTFDDRAFDPRLFQSEAERILWKEYLKAEGKMTPLLKRGEYEAAIEHLVPLKEPIDRYFDDVLVMTEEEEIRRNRLGFLKALADLFLRIGDFSAIVMENVAS